jgi:hypothetical protein
MAASSGTERRAPIFTHSPEKVPMTSSMSEAGQAMEAMTGPSGGSGQHQ